MVILAVIVAAFVVFAVIGMIAEGNPYDRGPDPLRPNNWPDKGDRP